MQMNFRLSEDWDEDFADLATADETAIRYYIALGYVLLGNDRTDLSANWGWIPLVDFALALREIADALSETEGSELFEFTESEATLQFDRIGDRMTIMASYAPGQLTAPFLEFKNQVDTFAHRLDQELLGKHPELGLNPDYQRLNLSR